MDLPLTGSESRLEATVQYS